MGDEIRDGMKGRLMRKIFRRFFLTAALIAGFAAAGSLMPSQANAMAISTPAAVQQAVNEGGSAIEQVRYVCRRVRHCGYRGCYWRRACYHTRSYGYRYRPYRHYRHYRYRYY
jgi:hypothetical protein